MKSLPIAVLSILIFNDSIHAAIHSAHKWTTPSSGIFFLIFVFILILTVVLTYYISTVRFKKRRIGDPAIIFEKTSRRFNLTDRERQILFEMTFQFSNTIEPFMIFYSNQLFESALQTFIEKKFTKDLTSSDINSLSKELSDIREKLRFFNLKNKQPIISTRQISEKTVGSIKNKQGTTIIENVIVNKNNPFTIELNYNPSGVDHNNLIGKQLIFTFTRQKDASYCFDMNVIVMENGHISISHTMGILRCQLRHYDRAEGDLSINIYLYKHKDKISDNIFTPVKGKITDISIGGVAFESNVKFNQGDIVRLVFHLPNNKNPLEISGKIIRVEAIDKIYKHHVQIIGIPPGEIALINDYVKHIKAVLIEEEEIQKVKS